MSSLRLCCQITELKLILTLLMYACQKVLLYKS
ncbi:hypothetical protein ABWED_3275 (plasmid) [Acinetobacter lwoffii]|nr:hypothetical protein ABWED_3275 [Acinetobacter lwoffii]